METYSKDFYKNRHEKTVYSANTILSILLEKIPEINSVIDVGCGVGTWLSVLQDMGIKEIKGIDGNWVDKNLLVIPQNYFEQVDLSKEISKQSRYDLAISLEVAEHLPATRAKEFVLFLTELSDFVLFSAAIPFQGGTSHVNEQWQHYWARLFEAQEYVVHDFIRSRIWHDNKIPFWYKQNILFFSRRNRSADLQFPHEVLNTPLTSLSIVHPDLYMSKIKPDPVISNATTSQKADKRTYKHH